MIFKINLRVDNNRAQSFNSDEAHKTSKDAQNGNQSIKNHQKAKYSTTLYKKIKKKVYNNVKLKV
jgi:hypothetical protein